MATVLVTGMSGTGKSTALAELRRVGHQTVETDDPGWCVPEPGVADSEWRWDEGRVGALLAGPAGGPGAPHLFVAGTRENQGRFYARFDAVVVLTAPVEVLMARIAARTDNPYGRSAEEQARIREQVGTVEPLLVAGATDVVDATVPVGVVVDRLLAVADRAGLRRA